MALVASSSPAAAPLTDLFTELTQLIASVDLSTERVYEEGDRAALRTAFQAAADNVAKDISRFALVVRSSAQVEVSMLADVSQILKDSCNFLCSGAQLLTKEGECGETYKKEVQGVVKATLKTLEAGVRPLMMDEIASSSASAKSSSGKKPGAAASSSSTPVSKITFSESSRRTLLHSAGQTLKCCEAISKLPVSDIAACKRKFLQCTKTAKQSLQEIAENHDIDLKTLLSQLQAG